MVASPHVKSPCIGVCSTGIGDQVCRGCKRYSHEIIHWNGYSDGQKRAIQDRLDSLLKQVVQAKVMILDLALLRRQIDAQHIRVSLASDPFCWIFALLKAGASQIDDLSDFGCRLYPEYEDLSLVQFARHH